MVEMACLFCLEEGTEQNKVEEIKFRTIQTVGCECKILVHSQCWIQYILHKGYVECPICHKKALPAPAAPPAPAQITYYPQRDQFRIRVDNSIYMIEIPPDLRIRRRGTHRLSAARFILCTAAAMILTILIFTFR